MHVQIGTLPLFDKYQSFMIRPIFISVLHMVLTLSGYNMRRVVVSSVPYMTLMMLCLIWLQGDMTLTYHGHLLQGKSVYDF